MININNKKWEEIQTEDVEKILSEADDETFFFEFKSDNASPAKVMEEVSAFSNTYGGYVLLGINDDKTIGGCIEWNEERIHTTIHDSITPTPIFDIKKLNTNKGDIFVIKIEEGNMPPYITSKGKIYERLSSGSYVIKDSAKLTQLYNKKENQTKLIKNKIELKPIEKGEEFPNNLFAYIDLGFSIISSSKTEFEKNFFRYDFSEVTEKLRKYNNAFSISFMGKSYLISVGELKETSGQNILAGINHFIEILYDGSVRSRIVLCSNDSLNRINISSIAYLSIIFQEIYRTVFDTPSFSTNFISAHKYQKLTVVKQFEPYYELNVENEKIKFIKEHFALHNEKYGGNQIITGNRFPEIGFNVLDKRAIQSKSGKFNNDVIFKGLFNSIYSHLGFIVDNTMQF